MPPLNFTYLWHPHDPNILSIELYCKTFNKQPQNTTDFTCCDKCSAKIWRNWRVIFPPPCGKDLLHPSRSLISQTGHTSRVVEVIKASVACSISSTFTSRSMCLSVLLIFMGFGFKFTLNLSLIARLSCLRVIPRKLLPIGVVTVSPNTSHMFEREHSVMLPLSRIIRQSSYPNDFASFRASTLFK